MCDDPIMKRLLKAAPAALLLACLPLVASARTADLAPPSGKPVLTVSGGIASRNTPDGVVFDLAMLQALPKATFTTHTIWTDGLIT